MNTSKPLVAIFVLLFFYWSNWCIAKSFYVQQVINKFDTTSSTNKNIADTTSAEKQTKNDTLKIISIKSTFSNESQNSINKTKINFEDYRYTGDLFFLLPFGYVNELGWLGQPSEVTIYGNGWGKVSYTENGILLNNRLSNSFDLNYFQSESIDSIVVLSLPRSFLASVTLNNSAVEFITRNKIELHPYSRIRFYQAPNNEGFVDGMFNAFLSKRLKTLFEVTNNSVDSKFVNSDYSGWKFSSRFHYLLSSTTNIILDYSFNKNEVKLNGGVDFQKILTDYPHSDPNSILYDNFLAPVNFQNRYMKTTAHSLNLHLLNNFTEHTSTNFSFYYRYSLNEFRQNERPDLNYQSNTPQIIHNNSYNTIGLNISQEFHAKFLNATFNSNLENTKINSPLLPSAKTLNMYSIAGVIKPDFFTLLHPNIFGKLLQYGGKQYLGVGIDFTLNIDTTAGLYFGYSSFQKPNDVWEEYLTTQPLNKSKNNISSLETSLKVNLSNIHFSLGLFQQKSSNQYFAAILLNDTLKSTNAIYFKNSSTQKSGINFSFTLKEWKLLLSSNMTYFFPKFREENTLPEYFSSGGIYYLDTLFNNNLELKAGFNFKLYGNRPGFVIDFEKEISAVYFITDYSSPAKKIFTSEISPFFKLDFFLSGKIQKSAIVYFTYENVLDGNYFVVPYYPMYGRGIRFGVAWEFLD
ncbi:putative porin [Melioribacteraceae bacterium 4301-Me]|uniref:putative porin n=1 Tax=Pyranulibacter aquaticus TaxID=3163344 RepID=UPI00359862F8